MQLFCSLSLSVPTISLLLKIAKTGSLCCVASRPHGSTAASGEWSVGPHEPYWRTNTSFSPPPSRWDFRFAAEEVPYDSRDDNLVYGSSGSSNSGEGRWVRGNHLYIHHYSASNGAGLFTSSPSDHSQGPQWTPPVIQEISADDYETATSRGRILGRLPSTPTMEGNSVNPDSRASITSHSDSSESEPAFTSCLSSHHNFSGCRSFLSKPVHPLAFPGQTPAGTSDAITVGFTGSDSATPQRDGHRWSSSSSTEFADVSEAYEFETVGRSCISSEGSKCGLCERFLSQRSPWSSRRIVRSGDMPVAGVLSCRHVFHAECLDQITPKACKSDPPCPLCARLEDNSPEQQTFSRLRNSFPRLRPYSEDGPSRPWGCMQMGDCVDGALQAPSRNAMLLLSRNRIKKNLSLKGNSSKEFPGRLRKNSLYSSQLLTGKSVDLGPVGCSMAAAGPRVRR